MRYPRCFKTSPAAILALGALTVSAHAAVFLDNTLDGTNPLTTSLGSITVQNFNAKVITTPSSGSWALDGMKMGLYSSTGSVNRTVTLDLRAVDGSNNPTGSVLATESFVVGLTTTPTYYDFVLDTSLWELEPNTTYALVFRSDAPSPTTSWTQPPSSNTYTTSGDFTFVSNLRSTNGGTSWSSNSYFNALQLSVTAVPEPATTAWCAGCVLLGVGVWRHRSRAGAQ
jgi:hypothetical protein